MKCRLLCAAILLFASPFARAATRHYYIAAEDVIWDYAPNNRNLIDAAPLPSPWNAKTRWPKTRFIEYTDATFSTRKPQPAWLGILGPIIRAEVGDEIIVDFFNRGHMPHSIHPHGLRYDKENEGASYLPQSVGARVTAGAHFTYHWFADAGSGPGPGQLSSVVWWYHGHTDEPRETNAGLEGPIIITAKGKANPDGTPKGVDQEFVASFVIYDELAAQPAGLFYSINGFIFGNLPGLIAKQGEKVRWYVLSLGNETGLHSPHWHGKTLDDGTHHLDVVELLPGTAKAVDMLADNPGVWLLHCHVSDHMEAGMMATFTIYKPQMRSCPVKLSSGNFWSSPDKFTVTVQNSSGKPIRKVSLTSEYFLGPQDLRRPFMDATWESSQPLPPGREQALENKANALGANKQIQGWALFPSLIAYEDGTTWKPEQPGECFQVFWRDPGHPELPILPPLQVDTAAD
ncbi:MAG TPA: multicopper oxidase domain-containing protein [Candidatus Sulfotelmatobacter sp.]|nr:multicopper oxidase domain-containing protein [Candidatus Sulfotelmatobacter sp.]